MIGIIFHHEKLNRIANEQESHENINFYYQLAEKNSVNLFFYSLRGLFTRTQKIKGYLYSYKDRKLSKTEAEIPKTNLLRTILKSKRLYSRLRRIEKKYTVTFINMIPERNKFKMYQYLSSSKQFKEYIPDTRKLNYKNLVPFIHKYNEVVIKPINGARGERIFKLSRGEHGYSIYYTRQQKQRIKEISTKQLALFLQKYLPVPSHYIVQRWLNFREIEGDKFDIRVSVQKNKHGEWKITGMVARAAAKGGIVTNIAQGGRAISFQQVNSLLKRETIPKMKKLSIEIAEAIEKLYPSTADLGLDIAIDKEDNIWFIEANHCDERYSFYESKDLDLWQATYINPFEYAYAVYSKS